MVVSSKFWSDSSPVSTPTGASRGNHLTSHSNPAASGSGIYDSSPPVFSQLQHHSRGRSVNSNSSYRDRITLCASPVEKLENFKKELEDEYQAKKNLRCQQFIAQFPSGEVPNDKQADFTQAEAIERTKFVVLKDSQVLQFELDLVKSTPVKVPIVLSLDTSAVNEGNPRSIGRFEVGKKNSAPRFESHSAHTTMTNTDDQPSTSAELQTTCSDIATKSVLPPSAGSVFDATSPYDETGDLNKPEEPANDHSTQLLAKIMTDLTNLQKENTTLKQNVNTLRHDMALLVGDNGTISLTNKVVELEEKFATVSPYLLDQDLLKVTHKFADLRIDLAKELDEIKSSLKSLEILQGTYLSKQTFEHENEFNKLTFNNKTQLIEKYLGIDISTTGPKPHNVLEALHSRIWRLETLISPTDLTSAYHREYKPLNDLMKNPITRDNAMISFALSPGYSAHSVQDSSRGSNTSSKLNATAASGRTRFSHRHGLRKVPNGQAYDLLTPSSQVNFHQPLASVQFDRTEFHSQPPTQVPLGMPGQGFDGGFTNFGAHDIWVNDQFTTTRNLDTQQNVLNIAGSYNCEPPMPKAVAMNRFVFPAPNARTDHNVTLRVASTESSGSEFGVIGSEHPKSPEIVERVRIFHDEAAATKPMNSKAPNSTEKAKELATIKAARELAAREITQREVARDAAIKEAAAKAWFLQKPGDFSNKPLMGLGQK